MKYDLCGLFIRWKLHSSNCNLVKPICSNVLPLHFTGPVLQTIIKLDLGCTLARGTRYALAAPLRNAIKFFVST